ncbi:hypothetical protein EJ04DRAFT_469403 [Polyplosphaeria fusca]|uniref:Fork-head domain-containing protein n=1 Tax=Polyplosphaeria fusca TaxID=682080 RepID=A0A9P4QWN6_9PLEO|nr:hypothetical protein EJ04DRAFT_469403 [Polyplosphaeria fusca]
MCLVSDQPASLHTGDASAGHNVLSPLDFDTDMARESAPDDAPSAPALHHDAAGAMDVSLLPPSAFADAPATTLSFADASLLTAYHDSNPPPDEQMQLQLQHQHQDQHHHRLTAYARLRFRDGSYYMHTYQVILGRDPHMVRLDNARLKDAMRLQDAGDDDAADAALLQESRRRRRRYHRRYRGSRSVVSTSGGIVNAPVDALPTQYQQQRRQSVASQSLSSSSHHPGASGQDAESPEHAPQDVLLQAFEELPDQLDRHVADDPHELAFVPIHPQHMASLAGVASAKGISRQHAKIYYNFDRAGFDLEVLSSNGMYHEETFIRKGAIRQLEHGDRMVISAVEIAFFLPDVALTEEQRLRQESTSRPMSFAFENGQGELEREAVDDSGSEDLSINPKHVFHMPVAQDEYSEDEDGLAQEDQDDDIPSTPEPRARKQTVKLKLKNKKPQPPPQPPAKDAKRAHKRKAARDPTPPEPPAKKQKSKAKEPPKEPSKDKAKGAAKEPSMNKSAERVESAKTPKLPSPVQLKKPGAEVDEPNDDFEFHGVLTAEILQQHGLPEILIGHKMEQRKGPGRPPKDGIMSKRERAGLAKWAKELTKAQADGKDTTELSMSIPKAAKAPRPRKDSNAPEGDETVRETVEKGDAEGPLTEKKPPKAAKPTRTPSPPMRIEDYTEEQLQRPSANYVVLIHEAISASKTGQMNLQQIYNYIERNYPWYKFKTTTSGWQSSVRHNLGQHDAFVKGDKEGKGFNWKINPAISIEKERRKRQVSPTPAGQVQRQGYPPTNGYPVPYGQPGAPWYPGMAPQGPPPNGLSQAPPPNLGPRLPPSLARNAAAAPAPQSTSGASPYASPWAGGIAAGSPPNSAPRPFPPSTSQSLPSTSASGYGLLLPTSAPQAPLGTYTTPGAQHHHPGVTSGSPYANVPVPAYAPHSAAGPSPQPPNATSSNVASQASTPVQQQSVPASSKSAHPPFRYPPTTNYSLVLQLEAFRGTFLKLEPNAVNIIDTAYQALLDGKDDSQLGEQTRRLCGLIRNVSIIKSLLDATGGAASKEERPTEIGTKDAKANEDQVHLIAATELPQSAASAAAVIAASGAATEATMNLPSARQPESADATPATVPAASSGPPQAFVPNMTGPPPPLPPQASRPSVEPLTPVPGSPAVGPPLKHVLPGGSKPNDTTAGATED